MDLHPELDSKDRDIQEDPFLDGGLNAPVFTNASSSSSALGSDMAAAKAKTATPLGSDNAAAASPLGDQCSSSKAKHRGGDQSAEAPATKRRELGSGGHSSPATGEQAGTTAAVVATPALPLTAYKCTSCLDPITHQRRRKCSCGLWSDQSCFCKKCVKLGTWVCAQYKGVVDLS